jgi:energy-coupling factor transporter ATP-binding protein EcfA2
MLVATHDTRLVAELFPRTIVLDDGQVSADGPTTELIASPDLLRAHDLELQ